MHLPGWLATIELPAGWGFFAARVGAMLALAALDIIGAVLAKEWTLHKHPIWSLAGLVTFGMLFVVYAASLHVAELSVVTFGWAIFVQVGLLAIDATRYGVSYSPSKWLAIAGILLLQAYLILGPNGSAG